MSAGVRRSKSKSGGCETAYEVRTTTNRYSHARRPGTGAELLRLGRSRAWSRRAHLPRQLLYGRGTVRQCHLARFVWTLPNTLLGGT